MTEIERIIEDEMIDLLRQQYPYKDKTILQKKGSIWMIKKTAKAIEQEIIKASVQHLEIVMTKVDTEKSRLCISEYAAELKKGLSNV